MLSRTRVRVQVAAAVQSNGASVSGLQQSRVKSDAELLRELCETQFDYKPWLDDSKCVRIGKSSPPLSHNMASERG